VGYRAAQAGAARSHIVNVHVHGHGLLLLRGVDALSGGRPAASQVLSRGSSRVGPGVDLINP
jgi:hypothetical protein